MTNIDGRTSWARRDDRRLVVPKQHLSQMRPSSRPAQTPVQQTAQVVVKQRSYAGPRRTTAASQAGFMPTVPVYSSAAAQKLEIDRQDIVRRAAEIRRQAKVRAERQAAADARAKQELEQQRQLAARLEAQRRAQAEQIVANRQAATKSATKSAVRPTVKSAAKSTATKPAIKSSDPTSVLLRTAQSTASRANSAQHNVSAPVAQASFNPFAPVSAVSPVTPTAAATPTAAPANGLTMASQLSSTVEPAAVAAPANLQLDQGGAAALPQPGNWLSRLAGAKITFAFKWNKQRLLTILRYLAVVLIVIASGYLAWDTYTTNRSVRDSFGGNASAAAMSIAGVNPATADQTAISQEQKAAYTVPADQPRYLNIPAIGVNARVMSVGVNSRGNIDTPTNLNDTAWYDGSAKPGQEGQVFIDGHTSFSSSINAAFNNLGKLKPGDAITIERGDGQKLNYRVTAVETVAADQVDMGKALNPPANAKRGLTLMTCTGTFNYRTQTADKRLIVYAVQE